MHAKPKGISVRPDIQYLRAFAVLSVLVFHFWPSLLTGGFVGVDVFFGISGFLITDHLMREFDSRGRINVPQFWARRMRRLLPASLTVILAVTAITLTVVPKNFVQQYLNELFASTFYFENWQLALNSVDYMAAENTPSPVQHFWSLGVEEQFYFAWPLIIMACVLVARRLGVRFARRLVILTVCLIVAGSLWASVSETFAQSPAAYFETSTRVWQLGLGALLALSRLAEKPKPTLALVIVRSFAWLLLAYTVVTFSSSTPFPGYAAAMPVLATLAIIAFGDGSAVSRGRRSLVQGAASGRRASRRASEGWSFLAPFKFVGDISYSVYLWHWPLLILTPFIIGADLNNVMLLVLAAVSILLGFASKKLIEEPLRNPGFKRHLNLTTFASAAAVMGIIAAVIVPAQNQISSVAASERNQGVQLFEAGTPCFGAAAWGASAFACKHNGLAKDFVTPSVASLAKDIPERNDECFVTRMNTDTIPCVFGKPGGTRVALVGDSHAYHWLAALQVIAEQQNWQISTFVRSSCPFSHVDWVRTLPADGERCAEWNRKADAAIAAQAPFKYVFTSLKAVGNILPAGTSSSTALDGFRKSWQPLIDRGAKIIAIHDAPRTLGKQASCALAHRHDLQKCFTHQSLALDQKDWLFDSAKALPGVATVDMTEYFCANGKCPQIVGNVFVYIDNSHISQTYARTLAPYLWQKLKAAGVGN